MGIHETHMKRAIELAKGGWGRTNPNPLVGTVIVKNEKVMGEGFHEVLGCAHGEIAALHNASENVKDGTLYVNLEPCSHYGRTPPCTQAIIKAGISKVVIAMEDPNPKVSGKGIRMLRDAGIETIVGILEPEARKLNEIFVKYIVDKKPFVTMKAAMTLDGKISSVCGDSKWISGKDSRNHVHRIRDRVAAIMVGINTVLMDDPALTTRLDCKKGNDPIRIIVDGKGKIPIESKVLNEDTIASVILATTSAMEEKKEQQLIDKGVKIFKLDKSDGHVDLAKLMDELYKLEIDSVLLEGGGGLNAAALQAGIVDKVMMFVAPIMIGGENAKTPVEGQGIPLIKDGIKIDDVEIRRFGEDILIEGSVRKIPCLQELLKK